MKTKTLHEGQKNELIIRTIKNEIVVTTPDEYAHEMKRNESKANSMRFIFAAFFFLITSIICGLFAQQKETFTAYTFAHTSNEINLGVGVNYQMEKMYFEAELLHYPELDGVNYTEINGTPLGLNFSNIHNDYRLFLGSKIGFIIRKGSPYAMVGLKSGIDIKINNSMFIGLAASYDYRGDSKIWNKEPYYKFNGMVKIGIYL